nr:hypothetical protein [uncultured Desulfovibrio sp.]
MVEWFFLSQCAGLDDVPQRRHHQQFVLVRAEGFHFVPALLAEPDFPHIVPVRGLALQMFLVPGNDLLPQLLHVLVVAKLLAGQGDFLARRTSTFAAILLADIALVYFPVFEVNALAVFGGDPALALSGIQRGIRHHHIRPGAALLHQRHMVAPDVAHDEVVFHALVLAGRKVRLITIGAGKLPE